MLTEATDRLARLHSSVCPSPACERASLPAAARLRPFGHVIDAAEGVRDPVLTAVPDQEDVRLGELRFAPRALGCALVQRRRLGHLPGLPMRSLDRPRDQVLEPAEDGAPLPGGFVGAEAVIGLDLRPAPGA